MRHGKSAYPPGVADHERPLSERGRRVAALAGAWLQDSRPPVDAVLCSTATRTRETLAATGIDASVDYENRIYEASPTDLIELIRAADADVTTLLIVGHAPGMPWTAAELSYNRDSSAATAIQAKFPTSALAVLSFDCAWADVDTGLGTLTDFHVPR